MQDSPRHFAASVHNVDFSYGNLEVLSDVNIEVHLGEIVTLVGPSGCGKSTLLRVIAGLEHPSKGEIELTENRSRESNSHLRFLFQDYDAYPWLTVYENVQQGSGVPPHPPTSEVCSLLERVGLANYAQRYPAELSGGMRKRLGLARVLIRKPQLLLLDEPFASLDVDTKVDMYDLLQDLATDIGMSIVLVTHDLNEAVLLSDRVILGTPRPMSIETEIPIHLGRPRTAKMMQDPEFVGPLRRLLWEMVIAWQTSSEIPKAPFPIEGDVIGWRSVEDIIDNPSHIQPEQISLLVTICREAVEGRFIMGGRSASLAALCVLLWQGSNYQALLKELGRREALEPLLALGARTIQDPSFAQPEWGIILLGVLACRYLEDERVQLEGEERANLLNQVRSIVNYFDRGSTFANPVSEAAGALTQEWENGFPNGLSPVVARALDAWPKVPRPETIGDLDEKMKELSRCLPAAVPNDDLAHYRLYLERQGIWTLLQKLGNSLV